MLVKIFILKVISWFLIFTLFILFDLVLIMQAFFIQIFFTKVRIGVIIAVLFAIVQYMLTYIVSNRYNPPSDLYYTFSFIPVISFILSLETLVYADSVFYDIGFSDEINGYNLEIAMISFCGNIVLYAFLTWYL